MSKPTTSRPDPDDTTPPEPTQLPAPDRPDRSDLADDLTGETQPHEQPRAKRRGVQSTPLPVSSEPPVDPDPADPADDLSDAPSGAILTAHRAVLRIHRNRSEEPALIFRPTEAVTPRVSILRDIWVDMGSPDAITATFVPGDTLNADSAT